jgi:hypothetical protein
LWFYDQADRRYGGREAERKRERRFCVVLSSFALCCVVLCVVLRAVFRYVEHSMRYLKERYAAIDDERVYAAVYSSKSKRYAEKRTEKQSEECLRTERECISLPHAYSLSLSFHFFLFRFLSQGFGGVVFFLPGPGIRRHLPCSRSLRGYPLSLSLSLSLTLLPSLPLSSLMGWQARC